MILPTNAAGETLGQALRRVRKAAPGKLSQEDASAAAAVSRASISHYEKDRYQPEPAAVNRLLTLYGATLGDIGFNYSPEDGAFMPYAEQSAAPVVSDFGLLKAQVHAAIKIVLKRHDPGLLTSFELLLMLEEKAEPGPLESDSSEPAVNGDN